MTTQRTGALADLRVLDLAGLPGQYAGRLLADLGADVIKVEPPGGDSVRRLPPFAGDQEGPERSLRFLAYNTNKRSVVLDVETPEGQETLRTLARTADVLLESFQPGYLDGLGLGYQALRVLNPRLVFVSVTPFGQTGPYSGYKGTDLHAIAMSSLMHIQGDDAKPPCAAPGDHAYLFASIHAVIGTLYALLGRERTGRGQQVDVSVQEALANVFFQIVGYSKTTETWQRRGKEGVMAGYNSYRCRDGFVSLAVLLPNQAKALFEWIGDPALQGSFWYSMEARRENLDFVDGIIVPFVARFTVSEFVEQAQARRLPCAPVNTPGAFADNPQFAARDYFVELEHPVLGRHKLPGPPYRMAATPLRVDRRAPLLGEHTDEVLEEARSFATAGALAGGAVEEERPLPLEGIRVLDFTRIWAGPYSNRLLADFGAEVIKIESSLFDTDTRTSAVPFAADLNRNKLSLTLDLHRPEARDLARRLAAESDVVIDNFALGVMERFGLGYKDLRTVNPNIIQVNMPGWGSVGPLKDHVAFGFNLVSVSGISYTWGFPDSSPAARCKLDYPDFVVGSHTALAILAALYHKARTGRGQHIEIAQAETVGNTLGAFFLDYFINGRPGEPTGNAHPIFSPHGCYPCKGVDAWCVIACTTDAEWYALRAAIGDPAWAQDPVLDTSAGRKANEAAIDAHLAKWTAGFTPRQVMHLLQKRGVPATAVQSGEDIYYDVHLRERGYIVRQEHPDWGWLEQPGFTVRLSETPGELRHPAPALGEHNREVLRRVLGMSDAEIGALQEARALI